MTSSPAGAHRPRGGRASGVAQPCQSALLGVVAVLFTVAACRSAPASRGESAAELSRTGMVLPSVATRAAEFITIAPAAGASFQAELENALLVLKHRVSGREVASVRVFTRNAADAEQASAIVLRVLSAPGQVPPAVSVLPGLGMPDPTQRVALEAVASAASEVNPAGLLLLAGAASATPANVVNVLARVATAGGADRNQVLRVTCFYESPAHVFAIRDTLARAFPNAAQTFLQIRAPGAAPTVECEAVGRLTSSEPAGMRTLNLPGGTANPYFSRATRVSTPRIAFLPMAHEKDEPGLRARFEGWKGAATRSGTSLDQVVMATNFWADTASQSTVRKVRMEYFGATVPAATGIVSEAISQLGARGSIELVLAVR